MFNGLRWEVVVCFVVIGGIVDHHCLSFLFIIPTLLLYYNNPYIKVTPSTNGLVRRVASLDRDNLPVVVFHYLILYEIYIKWMAYNGRVLIRKGLLQYCLKICLVIFSEEIFLIFFLKILEIC